MDADLYGALNAAFTRRSCPRQKCCLLQPVALQEGKFRIT